MQQSNHISVWKHLVLSGRLKNLYDSDKWEFGHKNFKQRSWKHYRKTQYKEKSYVDSRV